MPFWLYEDGAARKIAAREADRLGPKGHDAGIDAAFVVKARDEATALRLAREWLAVRADEDATCDEHQLVSRGSPFGDGYAYLAAAD